ncbi:ABC transporter substrate-binding protein [Streptomyces boninensis]|uniref:ABC transporter substrate-binding protein n=1 Tax=Streptomyces boninensis TaxID=2039455 RepID=UPI003B22871D
MARSGTHHPAARLAAIAVALGTVAASAACTTGSDGAAEGGSGGNGGGAVSYQIASDPTTLDPAKGTIASDLQLDRLLYDTLVARDDGGKIVGRLAKSWEMPDAKNASFTLNSGVTCTDGTKVTATTVADSLKRLVDPKTGGATVFGAGNKADIKGDDGSGKVTIKLQNPWSDLLYGLSLPQAGIVCPKGIKDDKLLKSGGKGAGTGRYYVSDAKSGSSYTLTARDKYTWAAKYAKQPEGEAPERFDVSVTQAESTMANKMMEGSLDYTGITGPDIARLAAAKKFGIEKAPLVRMMVAFNERKGHPGADPAFRKAVAQALDAKAFNQSVTKGTGTVMHSIADKTVPCALDDAKLITKADPKAAKAGLSGKKIKLVGTNAVAGGAGNEFVQASLKAAGAQVELKNADNTTWGNEVLGNKGDWDVTVYPNLNVTNLLTSPAGLMLGDSPPKGRNFAGIDNAGFAKGFGAAMATTDEGDKCAAWGDAQKALLAQNDVVPLAAVAINYVTSKRVAAVNPDGVHDASSIRLVK